MNTLIQTLESNILYFPIYYYLLLTFRFAIITGGSYFLLWHVFAKKLKKREIQERKLFPGQINYEIKKTLIAYLAWAVAMWPLSYLLVEGQSSIYLDWNDHPLWIVPINVLVFMFWHDIYFTFTHKWLHTPWAYKHIHYIHHTPKVPTPFSTHCFHWQEAVIQVMFVYPLVIFMPMHAYIYISLMTLTHFFSVWGHFNYELMPLKTWNSWWGSWVTTATHHNLHHKYNKKNYALYLKFWDKRFGSLHPKTAERFDQYIKDHS